MVITTKNANAVVTPAGARPWLNAESGYNSDGSYAIGSPLLNGDVVADYAFPAFNTSEVPDGVYYNRVYVTARFGSGQRSAGAWFSIQMYLDGVPLGSPQVCVDQDQTLQVISHEVDIGGSKTALRTAGRIKARITGHRGSGTSIAWLLDSVSLTMERVEVDSNGETIGGQDIMFQTRGWIARDDDVSLDSSTAKYNASTGYLWAQESEVPFRLRLKVGCLGPSSQYSGSTRGYHLRYLIATDGASDGIWHQITSTSPKVRLVSSKHFSNGAAIVNERCSIDEVFFGPSAFQGSGAGQGEAVTGGSATSSITLSPSQDSEIEFCLLLDHDELPPNNGTVCYFRLFDDYGRRLTWYEGEDVNQIGGSPAIYGVLPPPPEVIPINGSATIQLDNISLAASGSVKYPPLTGDAAIQLAGLTLTADGSVKWPALSGGATINLGGVTLAGSGSISWAQISGQAIIQLDGVNLAASGTTNWPSIQGAANITLDPITGSGSGGITWPTVQGVALITLDQLTGSGSGAVSWQTVQGVAHIQLDPVTCVASGTGNWSQISGVALLYLDGVSLSASAEISWQTVQGVSLIHLDPVTASGAGRAIVTGSAEIQLDPVVSSGAADAGITGSANIVLQDVTLQGAASVSILGDASITLDAVTLTSSGISNIGSGGTIQLDPVTLTGDGVVQVRGSAEIQLDSVTLDSGAGSGVSGSAVIQLDDITCLGAVTSVIVGELSITLNPVIGYGFGMIQMPVIVGDAEIQLEDVWLQNSFGRASARRRAAIF